MPQTNDQSQKEKKNMALHRVRPESDKALDTKENILRVRHHAFPSGVFCELQPNGKWKKVRWK